jgi:alpha-beta hydrolase superfamily lysophospholipase
MSNDRGDGNGSSPAAPRRRGIRLWLRRLGWLIALLLAALLALIFWLWLQSHRPLPLPAPSGPFAVGRLRYELTEPLASDPTAPGAHQPRRIVMWIWYPAEPGSGRKASYVPEPLRTPLRARGGAITNLIIRDVDLVRAQARTGAAVAGGGRRFPILLLKSGLGALALDYTSLAESLASAGYVVVGSDAPNSAALTAYEDGSTVGRTALGHPSSDQPAAFEPLVRIWAADTRYELDALARLDARPAGILAHRLDLGHVGAFGHSFGGAAATEFCWEDSRCKAAADVDGRLFGPVVQAGLAKPFLFLMSDHGRERDPAAHLIMAQLRTFWAKLSPSRRLTTIKGTRHFNFSDNALRWTRLIGRPAGAIGPIGRRRALEISARELDAFFSAPLGQPRKPEPTDEAILHDWVAPAG